MSPLSRNARRRLALYGAGALLVLAALAARWYLRRLERRWVVPVRDLAAETKKDLELEPTRLLREYLRIDTSNPPGPTRKGAEFLAHLLDCEGIPWEMTGGDPERPILVARLKGGTPEGAVVLLSHMDVVPPGDLSQWTKPPFAAEMGTELYDRQYLYGRGTLDMKGQTIAYIMGLAALRRADIVPRHDIVFVAESGEESFDPWLGMAWLQAHRPDLLRGVTDVLNEGGVNEVVTSDVERYGIEVMQKAIVSDFVEGRSKEGLEAFRQFLQERDKALPVRLDPTVRAFMRFIAPSRSDVWGRLMLGADGLVLRPGFLKEVPEVYRSLLKDMIYEDRVEPSPSGGFSMRVVRTLLPGSSVKASEEELSGWAKERGLKMRRDFVSEDSVASPASGRAWDVLERVLSLDPANAPVGIYILNGNYTTSSYVRAHGLRAYGISPFHLNIMDGAKIHHLNERISLPEFIEGVERMKRIVLELATAP